MKFCINCSYYKPYANCYRDKPGHYNLVLGESKFVTKNCYDERQFPYPFDIILSKCGRRGRFFVEKTNLDSPKDENIHVSFYNK